MRNGLIALCMALCSIAAAEAQVSVGVGLPGVSIGINVPTYPALIAVPGYPVYYAPQVGTNYFFYDGMYWVYQRDNWYASTWYNGPWGLVGREAVPYFVLRIPVSYYRHPPTYFRGWQSDAPPHWGEHWGNEWQQSRSGWDNWNRSAVPAPAPLPVYQRQYAGNGYPRVEQQQVLQTQNYRYQPQDPAVQQRYQAQRAQSAHAPAPNAGQGIQRPTSPPSQSAQGMQRPTSPPPQTTQGMQHPTAPPAQATQRAPQQDRRTVQQGELAPAKPSSFQPASPPAPPAPRAQQAPPQREQIAQREQPAPKAQAHDKGHQQDPKHVAAKGGDNGGDKGEPQGGQPRR